MTDLKAFRALSLAISAIAGLAAIVACTIQLREPHKVAGPTQSNEKANTALGSDLARCRSVTSEQAPAYERCQRAWAENRRRFFGHKANSPGIAEADTGGSPSLSAPKDQSRIPQGSPSVVAPREGDQ
ncbi:putative entry exclusion protein TrbK-alt [Bradyrhizobium sp. ISRA443]|uniref:putative entry exclusion protein TrbK-alt n=1 Tax=unclassified Bradyrhizobium TaxID=2631580 RepID=UPI00247900B2|nr:MULTISPECIES: putative entry exclusion protein TrbK-alt [unclassified Bradyrhizobium]WGR93206.1 putative entry exclusion protein TrbK-alt [Bradyrhizobium sp. ISRA435]WGR97724.1 putative entry exclusion protein TrbK-alt [Bradyrhizobium sp. ISRA436]WGS04614.1 putative entry exclusion protein TrbK-alt [Bradyrhizobium sp. ISRA437]WGS11495.1 putative entry exclusion protein TrbK-alt [Bradyrhizobium sp. ISRA443]